MRIPIYDGEGDLIDFVRVDDDIVHVDGRVSKGERVYYKGLGVPYRSHYVERVTEGYDDLAKCDVFYLGHEVSKHAFAGKTGIFKERYQAHFTDWIGACGEKELQIVENLWELDFSWAAIDVKEFVSIDDVHKQYYLIVDYPDKRIQYLDEPEPFRIWEMLHYMIHEHWNFPWDKGTITDISCMGRVTDVADVFMSSDLKHKLGTVYSVLYSLAMANKDEYIRFCKQYSLDTLSHMGFVINSLVILSRLGVDISPIMRDNMEETYRNAVKAYLMEGKNCGYCGVGSCHPEADPNKTWGEFIKQEYLQQVSAL